MHCRAWAGVPFLLLSMVLTPLGDGLSKVAASQASPLMVTSVRYLGAALVGLVVSRLLSRPIHVPADDRFGIFLRTLLVMAAMILLVEALTLVPLATATGGFLISPVAATLLSVLFLGERLSLQRIAGVVLSLAGAILIARPAMAVPAEHLAGVAASTLGGLCLGGWLVATRLAAVKHHARPAADTLSTLVVQSLVGGIILLPLALLQGGIPDLGSGQLPRLLALGGVTAACHFLTVAAFMRSEASLLSPFLYANLAFAVPVGVLWFGEWPDLLTLTGLSAIALGGIIVLRQGPRPLRQGSAEQLQGQGQTG